MQSTASQQKEFGRRTARPALRVDPGERARARDTRVIQGAAPGLATRNFLKSGATLHMGKADPDARRRAAAVLAVTGGLLYGAAIAPHALSGVQDVRNAVVAGADLSHTVVMPFVERIASLSADAAAAEAPVVAQADEASIPTESFAETVRHVADGAARGIETVRQAAATTMDAAGSAVSAVARTPGRAADAAAEAGRTIRAAAHDFVDGQVEEMRKSAGMIAEGLAPLVAQVAEAAVEARQMLIEDLERQSKLAEIEKTGVVVDIPGFKSYASSEEIDAQVTGTMAALVDGVERRIAANTPAPAKVSMTQPKVAWATPKAVTPGRVQIARAPANTDEARTSVASTSPDIALTQRAGYRVDGDTVHIGGSAIKASTVASIAHAARITNNDPVYLASLAGRESNFKTSDRARTSSADGPFQFIVGTWFKALKDFGAKLGLGSVSDEIKPAGRGGYTVADAGRRQAILKLRQDPFVSGVVVSEMEKSDRAVLEKALGRQATAGERYMPHFLGIGDAVRMVSLSRTNPSAPAADYFKKAAAANHSLFYAKGGAKYSVAQVIGGFKNWFEGPNGGMARYSAFAQAAERVPVPAAVVAAEVRSGAHQASVRSRAYASADASANGGQTDHRARPVETEGTRAAQVMARATATAAAAAVAAKPKAPEPALQQEAAFAAAKNVTRTAAKEAAPRGARTHQAKGHEVKGPAATAGATVERPIQTVSLTPNDRVQAEPSVNPAKGGAPSAAAGDDFEIKWVKTPIVPGKPATYTAGGQIGGYVDGKGLLRGYATSLARSKIIEGFGENFARLPKELQDHLQNAAQFDLNFLAQYAHRWMPKGMRDGFAEHGLTFIAAVPQTGGKMVAVKVPKPKEAIAAVAPASEPAARPVASAGEQTRSAAPVKAADAAPSAAEIDETMAENVREMPRGVATDPEGAAFELASAAVPVDELETLKQQPLTQDRDVFAGMTRPVLPPIPSGLDRELAPGSPLPIVQIDWTPWDKPGQAKDQHQTFGRSEEEARRSASLHSGIRIERRHPPAEIHHVPAREARRAPPAEPAYEPMRPRGP